MYVCANARTDVVGRGVKSQLLRLVPKLALGGESGFPYDETKCWLGVDHIKRLRHCWSGNRRCVVIVFFIHYMSVHQCFFVTLKRQ